MSHDNECITCRCSRKTGEVWIRNKECPAVILCPHCARDVKGNPSDWEVLKSTTGILDTDEAQLFNAVAQRLVEEYGFEGGSEFQTEWGTFYFCPNK